MVEACRYFLSFLIYSFLGWCCESVYCSVGRGKLINRGFLNGPLCPVYGFGALLVVFLLKGAEQNVLSLFFSGMVVTSALEYFTSCLLEKLFHMKWWDYSGYRFQLNGRVCLQNSLMFGGLSVFVILVLRPGVDRLLALFSPMVTALLTGLAGGILLVDTFLAVRGILRMKGYLEELDARLARLHALGDEKVCHLQQELDEYKEDLSSRRDALENEWKERAAELRQRLDDLPGKWTCRRITDAFPNLRTFGSDAVEQLREHLKRK